MITVLKPRNAYLIYPDRGTISHYHFLDRIDLNKILQKIMLTMTSRLYIFPFHA